MSVQFIWQIPTGGDSRYGDSEILRRGERRSAAHPWSEGISDPRGTRFNYFDHLHQIARAAELASFDGLRVIETPDGEEPWIVAGYLSRGTRRLKLIIEFEASRGSSVYAAKNTSSLQRFANGRFAWQISAGGDAATRRAQGDFVAEADLGERIDEFLTVARGVLTQSPFSFKGRFFEVLDGGFRGALSGQAVPVVYLSGASDAALALSARQADVHVFEAAPAEVLRGRIEALAVLSGASGRQVAPALRLNVLARETTDEAVFDARRYFEQSGVTAADALSPYARLWSGLPSKSGGAAATLVGSYAQVSDALLGYVEAGVQQFLLSASPALEEAYRLGEHVLPVMRARIADDQRRAA
jgi:alkanesulfonate monooxygenase